MGARRPHGDGASPPRIGPLPPPSLVSTAIVTTVLPALPYRTRYAPSPTGAMHLGHARTALLTWLRARSEDGAIVMRIEDIDAPRVRAGAEAAILRDHEWLGLDWDEGPFRQSERLARYDEVLAALGDRVYPCTCTRREVHEASAPHGDPGVYPGLCRQGPLHPEREAASRFRMDEAEPFVDGLAGPVPGGHRDDFVLRRRDGLHAYQLVVVVDDHDMGITEVIRGDDLLSSTPRQVALYRALGWEPPAWLHVPLVVGDDGVRLAKRHGAIGVDAYRDAGWSPERLLGVLGASLGLPPDPEPIALAELRERFALDQVHAGPFVPPPPRD